MALELVRRYDFDPSFVFATVLLFVVFTFWFRGWELLWKLHESPFS